MPYLRICYCDILLIQLVAVFAPHTQFRLARTMLTYRWKKIQIAEWVAHVVGVAVSIHSFFTASAAFCATGGQKLVVLVFALMDFAAIVFHWLINMLCI